MSAAATGTTFRSLSAIDPDRSALRVRLVGLSPEQVAADQRSRISAALPGALTEHGYEGPVVGTLLRNAHVSRKTFYELFGGQDEALLACHREALSQLRSVVGRACIGEWPDRVRAALTAILATAAADPGGARLIAGDPYIAGPHAAELRGALLGCLGPHLRCGRRLAERPLAPCLEEGLIGGVTSVVLLRIYAGEAAALTALAPQLSEFLLAPYLGPAEASRLARR